MKSGLVLSVDRSLPSTVSCISAYLYIKFVDILKEVSDAIFITSPVQQHKLDIGSRQEGGNLLVIHLRTSRGSSDEVIPFANKPRLRLLVYIYVPCPQL